MADHPMPPSNVEASTIISEAVLTQILAQLDSLTISNQVLNAKVGNIQDILQPLTMLPLSFSLML
jgi:hypothetical protein